MDAEHHDHGDGPADDPRPVFQGDWKSATGAEKGRHSERVRQWRERQGLPRQRGMAASTSQPVPRNPPPSAAAAPGDAATRTVLESIRDDGNALASDRIRASQALIALDRGDAAATGVDSDLVQLRAVLETLTPEERLAWLQGERAEHAAVEASTRSA